MAFKALKIRKARPTDNLPWNLFLMADNQRHQVKKYLKRGELYLALLDKKIVGELILMEARIDVWEIMNVAVEPKYRGKGVGATLVKKAISIAKKKGAHRIEIGTDNHRFKSIELYQQCGFRIVGVDKDFFVRRYKKIFRRNGVIIRDMIRMELDFFKAKDKQYKIEVLELIT